MNDMNSIRLKRNGDDYALPLTWGLLRGPRRVDNCFVICLYLFDGFQNIFYFPEGLMALTPRSG